MPPPTGRRAANRAATDADIKAAALRQIAEVGAPSLSLRAVAREAGLSPAGLYRYYDGRDALLTALLVDAYGDLADVVAAAVARGGGGRDPATRIAAGIRAYRAWALAHPGRFLLIFGTPVPGYAAPEGGPTVEANRRLGGAFLDVAAAAWADGLIEPPPLGREPTPAEAATAAELARQAPGFPVALVPRLLGMWARWHGLVLLEVTHQLDWAYPDPTTLFEEEVDQMVDDLLSSSGGSG